ncbi:MAG: competence/damage-inducible protein A [Firmicutes bacterium]|nr:competence/damage-inducible protein A [Bacillota bacterium]
MLKAEILAIGTELLLGQIENSHARYLSQDLATIGVAVYYHSVVGDNLVRATEAFMRALSRSDIVIATGGLGPTDDDVTRQALARAAGQTLRFDQDAFDRFVRPYFDRIGKSMTTSNRRQAERVGDATFLPNPRGTAPGQYFVLANRHVFLLPGPPLEMRPMYVEQVRPRLIELSGGGAIRSHAVRLYGIGESDAEERMRDLIEAQDNPTIAPLAGEGEMLFRITARADDAAQADALIEPVVRELHNRLGAFIYGQDEDTLASATLRTLREKGRTVAFAESCTAGLATSMLVDVPGSSAALRGSIVAYDNAVKTALLGVEEALLAAHGAVSEEAARAMAAGVKERVGSDYGVGITGIAGPDGGTDDKPVGLVYVAVDGPTGQSASCRVFAGGRDQVRIRAAKMALHAVRREVTLEK